MRYLVVTMGSRGDINPFAGIAQCLQDRGHEVVFLAPGYYETMLQRLGIRFEAICSTRTFVEFSAEYQAAKGLKRHEIGLKRGVFPLMRPVYRKIEEKTLRGKTVVVAQSLSFGARIANEKLGTPMVSIHLGPLYMRDLAGSWAHHVALAALDRGFLDPKLAPEINAFRAELGLPPVRRILHRWFNSPSLVMAMFPDWYSPRPAGWPAQFQQVGFPLFDGPESDDALPQDVEAFLREGAPPVVVTGPSTLPDNWLYFQSRRRGPDTPRASGTLLDVIAGRDARKMANRDSDHWVRIAADGSGSFSRDHLTRRHRYHGRGPFGGCSESDRVVRGNRRAA